MSDPRACPDQPVSLAIADLTFGYPAKGHRLQDVSLTLREAEICCLLGPNGAGKTTLLRCLLGLLKPERGTIRIQGQDIKSLAARDLARLVAYVPQSATTPFPFTALEMAVMGRTPHLRSGAVPSAADRRIALGRLDRLGIAALADRIFSTLSGGQRQMVLLARALVQDARILVLDEPTAALDYGNEVRLLQIVSALADEGRSVLMTTHQPAQAFGYADRAVLLRDGAILAQGPPDEVLTSESLTALYGATIHVVSVSLPDHPGRVMKTCLSRPDSGWRGAK
ncbi:ABC transporter ATP-binding protein [Beijerinckia sp. L45]|uniref:ABC transporter ATP-binding protein n=1 Tax=Beijerinckia sp. L45 TaxID=1641855 RepID=UPI00131D7435|nr:ABC transporter ATP-binding protein [Beijerinckia sp. L45]